MVGAAKVEYFCDYVETTLVVLLTDIYLVTYVSFCCILLSSLKTLIKAKLENIVTFSLVAEHFVRQNISYTGGCVVLGVTGPWFDMYLKDRRSIVLNCNPFMMMRDDPRPEYNDQVCTASFLFTYHCLAGVRRRRLHIG